MNTERMSSALAENLLTLLAHSDEHGKMIASIIDTSLFEGEMRNIADGFVSYWREHASAPKSHAADIFADIMEDRHDRRSSTYKRIVGATFELFDQGVNAKYVLTQLRLFTRLQKLKDAIFRAAEELNQPKPTTIVQVEEILGDILRARDFQFEPGLRLDQVDFLLDYLGQHYREFTTGIAEFDHQYIVPSRGTIFGILGGAGRGKTWGMVHIGKRALRNNKKVLHITPEVGGEDVMQRYYQSLWSIPKRGEVVRIPKLDFREERSGFTRLRGISHEEREVPFAFSSENARLELNTRAGLIADQLHNLIIKRVAPRQMSMNGLRGFLDSLESAEGYIPDMVIADSIYLMKAANPRDERRIAIGTIVEDFRAVMIERNMAGVFSHQLSRAGYQATRAGLTHVGEDWSVVQTADILTVLAATDAEQEHGLARLYADKVRSDKGNIGVLLTQCYDIGQFALATHRLDQHYWDYLDELREEGGPDLAEDEGADHERD